MGLGMLAGCGTQKPQVITSAPAHVAGVKKAWVKTCIPPSDQYVTLDVTTREPQVSVFIGHPLTAQGAGIPTSRWTFKAHGGRAAVAVPANVVFYMNPNGQLLGDVVDTRGRLRLLFWGPASNVRTVLRGGPLIPAVLGTWSVSASTMANPALKTVLHQDESLGWNHPVRVRPSVRVVGDGRDAWLSLRIGQSFDVLAPNGTGGNVVFRVMGISGRTPLSYTTPPTACTATEHAADRRA